MARLRFFLVATTSAVLAMACSLGDGTVETTDEPQGGAGTSSVEALGTDPGLGEPESDATFPEGTPSTPTGSVGFSHYVYARMGDDIKPFLLEGPAEDNVRCQEIELPCSYLDLRELAASGDPIPPELGMSPAELHVLVEELDELSAVLVAMDDIEAACAAGYEPFTTQQANMGIHLRNPDHVADGVLDPGRPDVVMFARPGGEVLSRSELGTCDGDRWTGDAVDEYRIVGAAFYLPLTADHPEGWTGPMDNWHVHFNSCAEGETTGIAPVSPEECEADGGEFFEVDLQWMIHAYVVPEFDNQAGVFAMWNPTVSPAVDLEAIEADRSQFDVDGAVTWSINDFQLGDLEAEVDQPVVFGNSDAAPHTVTAEDGSFDSGTFGAGGTFEVSFDEPGTYEVFCALHPSMTGSVTVTDP